MSTQTPASNPKDHRLRPFRSAAMGLYLVVVVTFSLLITASVVRSVQAMTPGRLPAADQTLTVKECVDLAQGLFGELDGRRQDLSKQVPARRSDRDWERFRVGWLERLREAESRCAVEGHSRPELKDVFRWLDRLMSQYTTHAVQYAEEIGPSVDRLRAALDVTQGRRPQGVDE